MIKLVLITFFLFINTQARENPFFPSLGEEDLPYTSNENKKTSYLGKASLSLPSTARRIKKVTIEYENLDASIEKKSIDLDNTIDWHLPIFISQSYKSAKKNETNNRKFEVLKKTPQSYDTKLELKNVKFFIAQSSLKIVNNDKLIRNFLLPQPHRIVMDFKKDSRMRGSVKKIKNSVFTKVKIGNHDGYYRVVLELDGYYRYKLKKQAEGYIITLE